MNIDLMSQQLILRWGKYRLRAIHLVVGYFVLVTVMLAGCSGSSNGSSALGSNQDDTQDLLIDDSPTKTNCDIQYVFGEWRTIEGEFRTEVVFTSQSRFVEQSDKPTQSEDSFGDYEIGTQVDLSSGVTGCRLTQVHHLHPGVTFDCSRVVYRDNETLYFSECGNEEVDFSMPYHKTDRVIG